MKKFIPYLLSCLIVATGTVFYTLLYPHSFHPPTPLVRPLPRLITIVVNPPGISQAEVDAKLQQVGLTSLNPPAAKLPAPRLSMTWLVYHYAFAAAMLAAFVGLVILFRRMQAAAPKPEPAA